MDSKNKETNGSLKNLCKRIRYIRDTYYKSYHLSGIAIDSFVYDAIGRSQWPDGGIEITECNMSECYYLGSARYLLVDKFLSDSMCQEVGKKLIQGQV